MLCALRGGDCRFGAHYWVKTDFGSIQNGNCLKQPENYEDRNHSEMSLSLNPVGGLRVLKTLLALTRGGLREPVARCSLPAHRHPLCALMPVNIGPAPALKADVGFTGVSERVKSCSSARAEFCAGGRQPASQQRLSGLKYLVHANIRKGCGRWHEGTAHANIAGTSFIRFWSKASGTFAPRPRASHQP